MSALSYLGSKISLITKSEIRYEGILYSLDIKESTIALAKVKSFGTEDRPTDRPVAPRNEVYDYIIFRTSNIKDLNICEPPESHTLTHDPAIIQHSQPLSQYHSLSLNQPFSALCGLAPFQHFQSQPGYTPMPSILTSGHYSGSNRSTTIPLYRKSPTSDAGVQVSVGNVSYPQLPRETREPLKPRNRELPPQNYQTNRRRIPPNRQQQNVRRNMPRRGRGRFASNVQTIEKFESEYDFEQANAEFQELENKLSKSPIEDAANDSQTNSEDTTPGAYDKAKSFFDDISCEATRSLGFPRFDWRLERKLNIETFGVSANNAWMRRRRGRGGFRRGFRGRGGQNRPESTVPQKTVTFDETPAVKEVEVVNLEQAPDPLPVIEVIADSKKADWPESNEVISENVWD